MPCDRQIVPRGKPGVQSAAVRAEKIGKHRDRHAALGVLVQSATQAGNPQGTYLGLADAYKRRAGGVSTAACHGRGLGDLPSVEAFDRCKAQVAAANTKDLPARSQGSQSANAKEQIAS